MKRNEFLLAALAKHSPHTKTDVKRFINACDKRFGSAALEYRMNFVVQTADGSLFAFSGNDFLKLGGE